MNFSKIFHTFILVIGIYIAAKSFRALKIDCFRRNFNFSSYGLSCINRHWTLFFSSLHTLLTISIQITQWTTTVLKYWFLMIIITNNNHFKIVVGTFAVHLKKILHLISSRWTTIQQHVAIIYNQTCATIYVL